ncbi:MULTISPECIES: hypothetical protein [unclassified Haladaptatus]|uniref:DUF7344 domain-containing protein n=2 Tax=Haladaptatus TaxID=367188 RepID=UPI00209C2F96|nr:MULTISPECIES: hypothetical protein [unclassified Haladaptatus]MCO8242738.1 hypothetical protein [Haladaptatus sp. AB643]MCO8252497.1 hypothetical protein [Haladaptatus sp. AB618]
MADQTTNDDGGSSRATASPAGPSTDVPPLSQDALFDALASRRSRYILHNLRSEDAPVTLDTIVDTVAAWEMDKSIDLVSDEHRRNVLMSLQHTQLPKLAMAGLVQYDEERGLIDKGIHADQADAYLDIAVARDDAVPTPE